MALSYNQINSITEKYYIPKLKDNVYRSNAELALLTEPGQLLLLDGGEKIVQPIISSKPGTAATRYFNGFDSLNTDPTDNITAAEFAWKQIYEPIRVSTREMRQNNGDAAKLRLIASKMKIADKNIKENLGLGLFSDGGASTGAMTTLQLTGLQAVLSESSTYGGIAVADMADWVARVDDNSGTNRALTLALMQSVYGECSEDEEKPDHIVVTQAIYNVIWSLFQPHQRLMSEKMSKLGFENVLTFNGAPIIVDSHMEANAVYFLNRNHLQLAVHSEENLRVESIEKLESSASMVTKIFWMGNLTCSNRRFQGKLDDVA